jgi:arylsulfatase A-like enzyme
LHLENQRSRVGFDDVWVDEEGRAGEGIGQDDYELFLGDHGYPGQRFGGGMNNNDYVWRPWHLPERFHVTHWAATSMARMIKRRDKAKPGFWYLSFSHPHPPLAPLQAYLDMYRDLEIPEPHIGDWAQLDENTPVRVRERILRKTRFNAVQTREIRRAFYALCTHIDHQIRVVLGTLREEGLLQDTVIMFMSDHGDCLGNHQQWAKDQMINDSCNIPLILSGRPVAARMVCGQVSDRLVGLSDVYPTLCDVAGIPCPTHVTGSSMVGDCERDHLYALWGYGAKAQRMVRDKRYKLIYFPRGNETLLFDLQEDPQECRNRAADPSLQPVRERLLKALMSELDEEEQQDWIQDERLTGLPAGELPEQRPNFSFSGQRGLHWPPPQGKVTGW